MLLLWWIFAHTQNAQFLALLKWRWLYQTNCQNQHFICHILSNFINGEMILFKHFTPHAIDFSEFLTSWTIFFCSNVELIYRDTSHICHVYKMYLFVLFGCQASMCMYQWNTPISMCDSSFLSFFSCVFQRLFVSSEQTINSLWFVICCETQPTVAEFHIKYSSNNEVKI